MLPLQIVVTQILHLQNYIVEKMKVGLFRGQILPFDFFQHVWIVREMLYQSNELDEPSFI